MRPTQHLITDDAIRDLRAGWAGLDAYVAICDLALDGAQPTADEWLTIERDDKIGLYEDSTMGDAREWCADVVLQRRRHEDR